jgi:hypothetical protein
MNTDNAIIYLDMDGVLVDFDKGALEVFPDFPFLQEQEKNGVTNFTNFVLRANFYHAIRETEDFWLKLDYFEGALRLWELVENNFKYGFITAPIVSDTRCCIQKRQWLADGLAMCVTENFHCTADKSSIFDPTSPLIQVLIDDRVDNIESWRAVGGVGILHKNVDDTFQQLKNIFPSLILSK